MSGANSTINGVPKNVCPDHKNDNSVRFLVTEKRKLGIELLFYLPLLSPLNFETFLSK